jgi:hypothetical protein
MVRRQSIRGGSDNAEYRRTLIEIPRDLSDRCGTAGCTAVVNDQNTGRGRNRCNSTAANRSDLRIESAVELAEQQHDRFPIQVDFGCGGRDCIRGLKLNNVQVNLPKDRYDITNRTRSVRLADSSD